MKNSKYTLKVIASLVVLILILTFAQIVTAQQGGTPIRTEGQSTVTLPVDEVTIEKKNLDEVITNIGREYSLSDETIIVGMNGKQVNIREMLVPCEAQITYNRKGNLRLAERIRIKQVYPNASRQLSSNKPK